MELIKLQESSDLKSSIHDLPLNNFYSLVPDSTYPNLRKHASRLASHFGSTYICEKTFSVMNFNKSKWRAALSNEHLQSILQISTTRYAPRCDKLVGEKSQLHISHKCDGAFRKKQFLLCNKKSIRPLLLIILLIVL